MYFCQIRDLRALKVDSKTCFCSKKNLSSSQTDYPGLQLLFACLEPHSSQNCRFFSSVKLVLKNFWKIQDWLIVGLEKTFSWYSRPVKRSDSQQPVSFHWSLSLLSPFQAKFRFDSFSRTFSCLEMTSHSASKSRNLGSPKNLDFSDFFCQDFQMFMFKIKNNDSCAASNFLSKCLTRQNKFKVEIFRLWTFFLLDSFFFATRKKENS